MRQRETGKQTSKSQACSSDFPPGSPLGPAHHLRVFAPLRHPPPALPPHSPSAFPVSPPFPATPDCPFERFPTFPDLGLGVRSPRLAPPRLTGPAASASRLPNNAHQCPSDMPKAYMCFCVKGSEAASGCRLDPRSMRHLSGCHISGLHPLTELTDYPLLINHRSCGRRTDAAKCPYRRYRPKSCGHGHDLHVSSDLIDMGKAGCPQIRSCALRQA